MSKRIHNSKTAGFKLVNCVTPVSSGHQNKRSVLTSNIASCAPFVREISPGGFSVCKDHILNKLKVTDALYATAIFHQNNYPILPPGLIMQYSGDTSNPPKGWLVCDGSALSKEQYHCLYQVIGSTYAPETSIEFYLPDLRGRVIIGAGTGPGLTARALGVANGYEDIVLTSPQMPSHTHSGTTATNGAHVHTVNDPGHAHTQTTNQDDYNNTGGDPPGFGGDNGSPVVWNNINSSTTGITLGSAGDHSHTFVTDTEGGDQPHDNMQPYLVVNYIIKY